MEILCKLIKSDYLQFIQYDLTTTKKLLLYTYFFLLNSSTRQLSFCKQTIHYRCSFQDEELKFYFNQSNISIVGIKSNYKVGIFEPQPSICKGMYRTTIVVQLYDIYQYKGECILFKVVLSSPFFPPNITHLKLRGLRPRHFQAIKKPLQNRY